MCYYCIICDNVYCYVIAIVFVWEALNGTIALLCCHVSMKLDVGLTKQYIHLPVTPLGPPGLLVIQIGHKSKSGKVKKFIEL